MKADAIVKVFLTASGRAGPAAQFAACRKGKKAERALFESDSLTLWSSLLRPGRPLQFVVQGKTHCYSTLSGAWSQPVQDGTR